MPTAAREWKKAGEDLELPSGNVCLAKKVGLQAFLKRGLIPNSLLPIIENSLKQGKPVRPDDPTGGIKLDLESLSSILDLQDEVTLASVLEPKVSRVPAEGDPDYKERNPDKLYIDDVDQDDKAFIFSWAVGGVSDLEQFRARQREGLDLVRSLQNMDDAAESNAGAGG